MTHASSVCAGCIVRTRCVFHADPAVFRQVQPGIVEHRFTAGESMLVQDAQCETLSVVKVGSILIQRRGLDALPQPIALLPPGIVLGVMGMQGKRNAVSAVAAGPARACLVPLHAMRARLAESPVLQARLYALMGEGLEQLASWSSVIGQRTILDKVAAALLLLSDLSGSNRVSIPSHAQLARILGTTRESVARSISALQQQGLIQSTSRSRLDLTPELRKWATAGRGEEGGSLPRQTQRRRPEEPRVAAMG